jgi:hypothetical protein
MAGRIAGCDDQMADDGFMPFEPRRHRMAKAQQDPPSGVTGKGEDAEPFTSESISLDETSVQAGAPQSAPIEMPLDHQAIPEPEMPAEPQAPTVAAAPCDHALEIRHEAIRLASIACGRALRYAAVLHPQTIAGFVRDALAAAGNPRHARIRLYPDADSQHDMDHELIWDAGLEPGDVIVECDDVTLRADLQGRAALLVRAAAER